MQPRLSSDGPVGQRKKRKVERKASRKNRIPSPLYECTCFDCSENPQGHPETGIPGRGRWISKEEQKLHSREHKKRGVASSLLGSLESPEMQLPIPGEFGFLPPPTAGPSHQTPPSPPRFLAPESSPLLPTLLEEVTALRNLITSASEVLHDRVVVFKTPPDFAKVNPELLNEDEIAYICALDSSVLTNSPILGYQEVLVDSMKWAEAHPSDRIADTQTRLQAKVLERKTTLEQDNLRKLLLQQWNHQAKVKKLHYSYDSSHYYLTTFKLLPPLVLMAYLLVASLYLLCGVSVDHCAWTLDVLKILVGEALRKSADIFAPHSNSAFRGDVRSVIDILDLGPHYKAYVSCPSCCQLYWFDPDQPGSFPEFCTNKETNQVCGAKLRRTRKRKNKVFEEPIREYHHHSMKDYVAYLHSRADLQQYLYTDPTSKNTRDPDVWDVWDAPYLRDFIGPDGSSPFVRPSKPEGRLIFSLNMDGFNPYGNKEAGKKVSIGGIYMICLNLPPSIRYNIENVYLVGVIPGPREPSLHQINYFLGPLVDDLLQFWNTGIYLSRTERYPYGWLVRCAVVPLVCDLPAARQMSGFAHYKSHHFCSCCTQDLDNIQNIEPDTWIPRDQASHRAAAQAWSDAPTLAEREACYKIHGVRWSELLRLPYWDPTRFTVIDSMHAFLLRLFSYHCRKIWGMNVKLEDGTALIASSVVQLSDEELRVAEETLRYGSKSSLKALPVNHMRQLCKDTGTLSHHGKKGALAERLLDYRIRNGWFTEGGKLVDDRPNPKNNMNTSTSATDSILIDSEIQYFVKKGVVPQELLIKTVEDVEDYFRNADNTTMHKLTKRDVLTLFAHRVNTTLKMPPMDVRKLTVKELLQHIRQKREAEGLVDERGRPFSKPLPVKKTAVLGREMLSEVRRDIRRLNFPSWMARAPSHPGEESWGKFSADQWRTFCTNILPVTLMRIWGTKEEGSIERRQLDNFMHLVTAVKIATMRKMTEDRVVEYERHMLLYLQTLQALYPDAKITPYQHLSLHFGSFLRGFGPTHAWRCFPFERFNYVMQNMLTNSIFGELEKTLFHKFCCAQRLRSLFIIDTLPSFIQPLLKPFNRTFRNDARGTNLNDILATNEPLLGSGVDTSKKINTSTLSGAARRLLFQWLDKNDNLMVDMPVENRACFQPHFETFGQKFCTVETSVNDSSLVFGSNDGDDGDNDAAWTAGTIQQIFSHSRCRADGSAVTQTFLLVAVYEALPSEHEHVDPFRRHSVAGGRLFLNSFAPTLVLVESTKIKAHFASCVLQLAGQEYLLALPLDKQ